MVYFKIDNFTCLIDNCSLQFVFETFGIPIDYIPDFVNNTYETLLSGLPSLVIHEHGIHISLNGDEYRMASYYEDDFELISYKFRKIRIDFSGSGLDWLRQQGIDIDSYLINQEWIEAHSIRTSRCDFAFDFVNCYESFIDDLGKELFVLQMSGKNVLTPSVNKGNNHYSYELNFGPGVKCIYLGATKGLRFVRAYDKLLEQTNPSGILKKPLPKFDGESDAVVSSWFRIELQVRKKYCERYLFGCDDRGEAVLKDIFNDFRVRNGSQPIKSIDKLMDWDSLPELRKMKIASSEEVTVASKSSNWLNKNLGNLSVYIAIFGLNKLIDELKRYQASMRDGTTSGLFKELNFNKRVNQYCIENDINVHQIPNVYIDTHTKKLCLLL